MNDLKIALACLSFAFGQDITIDLGQPSNVEQAPRPAFRWRTFQREDAPTPAVEFIPAEKTPDCQHHPKSQLDEELGPPIPPRGIESKSGFYTSRSIVEIKSITPAMRRSMTKAGQQAKQRLTGLAPTWCAPCLPIKERLVGNPYLYVSWIDETHPDFVELDAYPAIQDPRDSTIFYAGDALDSWASLTNQMAGARKLHNLPALFQKPAKLTLGTIEREKVDASIDLIRFIGGDQGFFQRVKPLSYTEGVFDFRMEGNTRVSWDTAQDGSMRFEFNPHARVAVSGLGSSVSAIVVGESGLTFKIDWLPDAHLSYR